MLEMYVSGVSTRKVSQVVEELCGKKMSKSFVSDLTKTLDPMVKEWKNCSLSDTIYPFLMVDVLYARNIVSFQKAAISRLESRKKENVKSSVS